MTGIWEDAEASLPTRVKHSLLSLLAFARFVNAICIHPGRRKAGGERKKTQGLQVSATGGGGARLRKRKKWEKRRERREKKEGNGTVSKNCQFLPVSTRVTVSVLF